MVASSAFGYIGRQSIFTGWRPRAEQTAWITPAVFTRTYWAVCCRFSNTKIITRAEGSWLYWASMLEKPPGTFSAGRKATAILAQSFAVSFILFAFVARWQPVWPFVARWRQWLFLFSDQYLATTLPGVKVSTSKMTRIWAVMTGSWTTVRRQLWRQPYQHRYRQWYSNRFRPGCWCLPVAGQVACSFHDEYCQGGCLNRF